MFKGRSLTVVNDFSVDEQIYLYEKTKELKEAIRDKKNISKFKLSDPDFGIYLMFLEDSTRTKESFVNAAKFHNAKVNVFDVSTSSFNKKESITDTIRMLFGYSDNSLFIIRTKLEGVCRWLESAIGDYADRIGYSRPSFINAGDGKHEHPTQEFLDEFSFLEQKNWDRSSIHIALVGDLYHGRTIHSKADGLKVFNEIHVDLIAPDLLQLPEDYKDKMKHNGYDIRIFESIEEYLAQKNIAKIWYFTRLQLERMGDQILEKADYLISSVTFSRDFLDRLPEDARFYHPLPRNRTHPTIPQFLDSTKINAWDNQAINGYFTRIIEIAMLTDKLGADFKGTQPAINDLNDNFIQEAEINFKKKNGYKIGIKPVENGIVIDHIGRGHDLATIWNQIDKIRHIMKLNLISSHGVYNSHSEDLYKGMISLPEVLSFDKKQIKMLAAIAPGSTLNIIKDGRILNKYRLHMPPKVYNFDEISCKNENCVSHPAHQEMVWPEFHRADESRFICKYCEHIHEFQDIWDV
ncbi:MAG: aspartate carbamoyltransferase [Spirochaetes bacterium]|nr:aspartate carbamoyltransferase [Spirochaetota bacterium]